MAAMATQRREQFVTMLGEQRSTDVAYRQGAELLLPPGKLAPLVALIARRTAG
jgi:hypothetical protein